MSTIEGLATKARANATRDIAAVQQQVRARVLRWFARAGTLDPLDARDMASWDHVGGFSLDASVRIDGHPGSSPGQASRRAGAAAALLCSPALRPGAVEQIANDQLIYRLAKPQPDGTTQLRLTPLELIDRLATLIPLPRIHRHRYHAFSIVFDQRLGC